MPYRFFEFELDLARFELRRSGRAIRVTRQVFDLIVHLARNRERLVTQDEIFDAVWQGRAVTQASLSHAVAEARKALGDTPESKRIIQTVYGRGYRWVAPTEERGVDRQPGWEELPFVGRQRELGLLTDQLSAAHEGHGRFVLVTGGPGIGKTRLCDELAVRARELGMRVARGAASGDEATPAFHLFREALAGFADDCEVVQQAPSIRRLAHALGSASGGPRTRVTADSAGAAAAQRADRLDEIVAALQLAADTHGLLLVLDDVHQADLASLRALCAAARRLAEARILAVATLRPRVSGADDASAEALTELARQATARVLALPPLSVVEVEELLQRLADPALALEGALALQRRSGGNPFFLRQLVALAATATRREALPAGTAMPHAIRDAVAAHTKDLPAATRDLLRQAALLGLRFDARVLAEIAGAGAAQVLRRLAPACGAGILRRSGPFEHEFVHELLREALGEASDPLERAELHLRAGHATEQLFGASRLDELLRSALHFREAAEIGGAPFAIAAFERCAERAEKQLAYEDAARYLADALELQTKLERRDARAEARLCIALGNARLGAGDRAGAGRALARAADLAEEVGDADLLAEAALGLAPGIFSLEIGICDPLQVELLSRALRGVPEGSVAPRLELVGRLALALHWSGEDARRERLLAELADCGTQSPAHATAALYRIASAWAPDSLDARLRDLAALHARRELLAPRLWPVLRAFRAATHLEACDLLTADREIALLVQEVDGRGDVHARWFASMLEAMRLLSRGRYDEATRTALRYAELGRRSGDVNVLHGVAAHTGDAEWSRGRPERALESARHMVERCPQTFGWRCHAAFLAVQCGRREEATAELLRLGEGDFAAVPRDMNWLIEMAEVAEMLVRLGIERWREVVYERLLPYRQRMLVGGYGAVYVGSVARPLGILAGALGRFEEAERHFEHALDVERAAEATPWVARTEVAFAQMLAARGRAGDAGRARELAQRARSRAEPLEMDLLVAEARAIAD